MKITAKFPGKCAACGERFPEGARVEWVRGEPTRHIECPSDSFTAAESHDEYEARCDSMAAASYEEAAYGRD